MPRPTSSFHRMLMTPTILPDRGVVRADESLIDGGTSAIRKVTCGHQERQEARMIVPFSISDFIDRAVTVYGDRTGVVDEPDQPAAVPRHAHLPRARGPRAAPGREARRARHRRRRPGRDRQPQQRPAADVVLRRGGLRPGAGAGQLPAPARRGRLHRRALRRAGAAGRPRARRRAGRHQGGAPLRARPGRRPLRAPSTRAAPSRSRGSPTRTPRPASTTPPARRRGPRACRSPTATSGSTRSPSGCTPA